MKLSIHKVVNKGDIKRERLIIKVGSETDAGDYVLFQTGYIADGISIEAHNTYWFPYKEVDSGDLIVVYTRKGKDNEKMRKNGKKAHFFYWGLTESIWREDDRAAVILHAPEWISKGPVDL